MYEYNNYKALFSCFQLSYSQGQIIFIRIFFKRVNIYSSKNVFFYLICYNVYKLTNLGVEVFE